MLDITISGLYEASLWAPTHTKVISIVDPTTKVFECDVPHHVERFHDIEVPLEGYQHPTLQNIENILEFSKTFTDTDKVLIHCHAGVSRSTATAILVLIQHGMGIKEAFEKVYSIRDCMNPNVMIINYGDTLLECNGELSDYYNKWSADNRIEYGRFGGQTWDSNTDAMKNILQMFK